MGARGWIILVIALVAMGLALFVVDFPRCTSDEMAPGIRKADLLLACRVCGPPRPGDLVLFTSPDNGPLSIRRVVAVPGDRVEVHKGVTLVNGKPLEGSDGGTLKLDDIDPVSKQPRPFALTVEKSGTHEYRVVSDLGVASSGDRPPETLGDSYFVVADRRTLVRDSRDYGPIKSASVRSIVLRVLSAGDHDEARQAKVP
ncbi:MAG: signal peptidase [Myxococcales bacterium]|nr:signal peptidase [Myxococcales bacterium]